MLEENSAAEEEVSAAVEEMSAQVEEVNASAQSLSDMARALQALVVQFKLEDDGVVQSAEVPPTERVGRSQALQTAVAARAPGDGNGHKGVPSATPGTSHRV